MPYNHDPLAMRKIALSAVVAAMLVSSSCGDVPSHDAPPVAIALLPVSAESDAALFEGILRVVQDCLYVEAQDGTRVLPAFMTKNTEWRVDWGALWVGDEVFRPGQKVQLGGSLLSSPPAVPWRRAPAANCDKSRIWATGNIRATN